MVFDSKFTSYENLSKLDDNDVRFVTIRRRGKKIVDSVEQLSREEWKRVRVPTSFGKTRTLNVNDSIIKIKAYSKEKDIRQVAITGHGKIKPALIMTNDFDLTMTILSHNLYRLFARNLV